MYAEVPKYTGTSEDFDKAHFKRYGREEGLWGPGNHDGVSLQFPQGSSRQEMYKKYHACTNGRKTARHTYQNSFTAAKVEFRSMDKNEKEYYETHTDGLTPEQHERLDPRAKEWKDKTYR